MGINQDYANSDSSHPCKSSHKKKKGSNGSSPGCKCSVELKIRESVDVGKCNELQDANVEAKVDEIANDNDLSSKGRKAPKSKKVKGDCNLNCAECPDPKKKERSVNTGSKENTRSVKHKKSEKEESLNIDSILLDKECETSEKESISKKRKKRNKSKKVTDAEKALENFTFVETGKPVNHEVKVKKQKKVTSKQTEPPVASRKSDELLNCVENTGEGQSESAYKRLSKAKRRKIRKKRVLAALGITGNVQVKTLKSRKKKLNTSVSSNEKSESSTNSESAGVPVSSDIISVKSEEIRVSEKILEKVFKKTEVKTSPVRHSTPLSTCEQVQEASLENANLEDKTNDTNSFDNSLSSGVTFQEETSVSNSILCCDTPVSSKASCSTILKDNTSISENKLDFKTQPVSNKQGIDVCSNVSSRREESFSDKVSIPNFLSHDNVEGLFRSALLNDITLSSRCSEKEVKNFFNTYGTFSEKNRTQFAEVEKLLLSSNKIGETDSPLFECEKSANEIAQEKTPFDVRNACLSSNNEEAASGTETFSSNSIESVVKVTEREGHIPSNSFVYGGSTASSSGVNNTETASLSKGIGWGPIYTSPNPENKVINSVNSTQIQRENKVSLSPLTSSFNTSLSRPEKSESRLLEIVENVLLVHERVREQLTSEKKFTPPRYCSNAPSGALFSQSEGKEGFQEKNTCNAINKNTCVNPIVKHSRSGFETIEQDSPTAVFKFDNTTNINRVRPLHECISTSLLCEEIGSEKESFQEKDLSSANSKNICTNSVVKHNRSSIESSEQDFPITVYKFDNTSNINRVRPLHECISASVLPEDRASESVSTKTERTDPDSTKMQKTEKSKEEIKAEREAKKMAKMARKLKTTGPDSSSNSASSAAVSPQAKHGDTKKLPGKSVCSTSEAASSAPLTAHADTADKNEKQDETSKNRLLNDVSASASKGNVKDGVPPAEEQASKSKAELKAERRAKQEAQRAAKVLQQQPQQKQQQNKPAKIAAPQPEKNSSVPAEVGPKLEKSPKSQEVGKEVPRTVVLHKVKLFNHLYVKQEASVPKSISATSNLHPAVVRLGVQYATKVVVGSNARCLALLGAMKQVIEDYKTPPQKEFSRGLESILQPSMAFLQECRPLSVSMTNAVKHLKWQMRHLPNNISDVDARRKLQEAIDTYIREQIDVAGQAICNTVIGKISSGDVILTYGCSSLLQRILIKAHECGTKFKVVVVDARPWREGKEMLRRLVQKGLHCSYVVMTAASFIMREATKVFLGAHALLANGYVMSRAGSSQVALLAHSYNVPVLVCCETHKFSERVQTDSIVYNELGAPDELVTADLCPKESPLSKWKSVNHLTPLNITYDVTPPDLVTAVVTELAILPCTSVPVVLRIKPTEIGF